MHVWEPIKKDDTRTDATQKYLRCLIDWEISVRLCKSGHIEKSLRRNAEKFLYTSTVQYYIQQLDMVYVAIRL